MGLMRRLAAFGTALALCLGLGGCAGQEQGESGFAPEERERLVIYTSHKAEVWRPIVREFEERTGIWVTVETGGSNELLERIHREEDAPRADVMFGGGVEGLAAYADCFTPYTARDADKLDARFSRADGLWTPFSTLPVVLIYNNKLLSAARVTGWHDLLSPAFRGHIAFADPEISGSCFTSLVTMTAALGGDWREDIRSFAKNLDGRQLDSSGAVLDQVADGGAWLGVTLEETALKYVSGGADVGIVYPKEGTSAVPDASAIVKGAPHEDNAKKFLDFTVSQDVQRLLGERFYRRSVRTDVPTGESLPDLERICFVDYDVDWASENREGVLMTWAFCLDEEETA